MPVPSVSLGTGTSTRSADGRAWATSDAPQDAGLAGSVRSDQSDRLAFGHGEVNFVENAVAVNLPRDAGDDEAHPRISSVASGPRRRARRRAQSRHRRDLARGERGAGKRVDPDQEDRAASMRAILGVMVARFVVAGTHSGVGKTTIATGLMAAFRARGVAVASSKVGPDFIDPGYHALATGRAPRNLDAWMCGAEAIGALAARAGEGAELLVVEGVMGLFDGAVDNTPSSTADIARLIAAPVVLVVDGSAMSASVAALVRGYRDHDPLLNVAGVILNRVSGDRHRQLLTEALDSIDVPVFGCLQRDDGLTWRDRHLGLVPVEEHPADVTARVDRLAELVTAGCDLDVLSQVADSAPHLSHSALQTAAHVADVRIAVAGGPAFTFMYRDNLEALVAAGATLVPFDPLRDECLPAGVDGLLIGGGFPEMFGSQLADNERLVADVRSAIGSGLVTWAECGGLMWLTESLDGRALAGVVPATAAMTSRLTLGYRTATGLQANPIVPIGASVRGHEFHYSQVDPGGGALQLSSRFGERTDGFATSTLLATYLHQHLGADPTPAERFVRACAQRSN
jgi:cobyrinic acid a,c-diamide synthase